MTSVSRAQSVRGSRRSRIPDQVFRGLTALCAAGIAVLLVGFVLELVASSLPAWQAFGVLGFVSGTVWDVGAQIYGALPFIAGTVLTSLLAMAVAIPVSLFTAIFLAELAPRWLAVPLTFLIELIAAIPSVVIGLWGLMIVTPVLRDTVESWFVDNLGAIPVFAGPAYGSDLFAASMILAIMVVPTIVAISREVISSVPMSHREAFLGLGATRWETVRRVVLPAAKSGIFGAIVLGLGRALGETMAVTMMIGNADRVPNGLFDQAQTIASKIATSFNEAQAGLETESLLALAVVLMVVSLAMGIIARLLIRGSAAPVGGG